MNGLLHKQCFDLAKKQCNESKDILLKIIKHLDSELRLLAKQRNANWGHVQNFLQVLQMIYKIESFCFDSEE